MTASEPRKERYCNERMRPSLLIALALLPLAACTDAPKDTAASDCADGETEIEGYCVPDGCAPPEGATISLTADVASVEDTLATIVAGDSVAFAPGTYTANIEISVTGVTLAGWCPAETILVGGFTQPTISAENADGLTIRSLSVSEGAIGIEIVGAAGDSVTIGDVDVVSAGTAGIEINGALSAELYDVNVRDTLLQGTSLAYGRGLSVQGGAAVVVTGGAFSGNHEAGIFADASIVTLDGTEVSGTLPVADGYFGRGIHIQQGASGIFTGLTVDGNYDAGVCALASDLQLYGSTVSNTHQAPIFGGTEESGDGVTILVGEDGVSSTVTIESSTIESNARAGIVVDGSESITVNNTTVQGNTWGVVSQNGASATASGTGTIQPDLPTGDLEIYDQPFE